MKKSIKQLALLMALLTIFSTSVLALSGCQNIIDTTGTQNGSGSGNGPGTDDPGSTPGGDSENNKNYVVLVKTAGGMKLSGITVDVYSDETDRSVLDAPVVTNNLGAASISLPESDSYYVMLAGVPTGYDYQAEGYYFDGTDLTIELKSSVIVPSEGGNYIEPAEGSYKLGSVMHDFAYTDIDGNTYILSELLQEKEVVLLNFWYTTCSWCLKEFPELDKAYLNYSEKAAVLAMNNYGDTLEEIREFGQTNGLNVPLILDNSDIMYAFDYTKFGGLDNIGYPITVAIDRYGVVCMIEVGAIVGNDAFNKILAHFTADDYQQKLINSIEDVAPPERPNVEMPSSEEIKAAVAVDPELNITFYPETSEALAEMCWPFIIAEKDGETCIKPSNSFKDSSYAFIHADIELKKGDVLAFDYYCSTELNTDIFGTYINSENMYRLSGVTTVGWQTCYTYVAPVDGTYKFTLGYAKDSSDSVGDDTVYIKDLRIVTVDDIDTETYIPFDAATNPTDAGDGYQSYVDIFFNEIDGYYHVGTVDGPILLANLLSASLFNEGESSITQYYYNGYLYRDYLESMTNLAVADEFFAEEVSGGYKFYRLVDGRRQYLELYYNSTLSQPGIKYESDVAKTKCVFTYDSNNGAWVTTLNKNVYYLGVTGASTIADVYNLNNTLAKNPDNYLPVYLYNVTSNGAVTAPVAGTGYYFAFTSSDETRYLGGDVKDLGAKLAAYLNYSGNATIQGFCSVNEELYQLLMKVAELIGYGDALNPDCEWLQICRYYAAFGTDGKQLEDPIKGLAYHSAFTAVEGTNTVTYDGRVIMPKGFLYEFIPTVSGVYHIVSDTNAEIIAGIYMDYQDRTNPDLRPAYEYEDLLRTWYDPLNCSMYCYMEAGTPYYINIAYHDGTLAGTFTFDLSYVAPSHQVLRYCSGGFFTTLDETDMSEYNLITGGLMKIVYDPETDRFYEYYGNDKSDRNPTPIYADFTHVSPLFSHDLWNLILYGGFDFSKTQDDEVVLNYIKLYPETYEQELLNLWGDDYDQEFVDEVAAGIYHGQMIDYSKTDMDVTILEYIQNYPDTYEDELKALFGEKYDQSYVDDVANGIYHGDITNYARGQIIAGTDYTEQMQKYLPVAGEDGEWIYPEGWITEEGDLNGCMPVTMELAILMQRIVDKYSFSGVPGGWTKLCVYFEQFNEHTAIGQ